VTSLSQFATEEPTLCFCCHRRAVGLAYAPSAKHPFAWLCDHPDCHAAAKGVYRMPEDRLDAFERAASLKAGDDAGAYLDRQRQTDLAKLSAQQWEEFLRLVVVGYSNELRRKLVANEAPF
jgi:hypothetical protein